MNMRDAQHADLPHTAEPPADLSIARGLAHLLDVQRDALRAFREVERARVACEAAAEAAHAAAVAAAEQDVARRRDRAARERGVAEASARSVRAAASQRKDDVMRAEVDPSVRRTHEARDRALPALTSVDVGWVREAERVQVPAVPDPGAELRSAVTRAEAAIQPVIDAVGALERWRRTRLSIIRAVGTVAAGVVVGLGIIRSSNRASPGGRVDEPLGAVPAAAPQAPAVAATSDGPPVSPRITLQYQDRADAGRVSSLFEALKGREGWRVGHPERVLPDAVNRPEVYGGVRFFFVEDSALARTVCEAVRHELAQKGYDVTLPLWPMITLQRQGHFRARRGLIEVWISPLPAPATSGDPATMGKCGR